MVTLDSLANTTTEFGLTCEYIRERKKRGKASRKDIAQQQAAAAAADVQPCEDSSTPKSPEHAADSTQAGSPKLLRNQRSFPKRPSRSASLVTPKLELESVAVYQNRTMSMGVIETVPGHDVHRQLSDNLQPMQPPRIQTHGLPVHNTIPDYTSIDEYHRNLAYQSPVQMVQPGMHPIVPSHSHSIEYSDSPYGMMSPQSAHTQPPPNSYTLPEESSNTDYLNHSPSAESPGWMLPSPSTTMYSGAQQQCLAYQLRYPVLQPLLPHLSSIMPVSLACDLLELYFQSSSSTFMQPISPYVLGYVFRKGSFLRQHNPRVCSPALLASMLWIGCLTSESPYLSSSPSARSQLSEKMINLTIGLLKPLVHQMPGDANVSPATYGSNQFMNGVTMGGFGQPTHDSELGFRKCLDPIHYIFL